ncbi:MAG: CehA/McbA family metallohydrolase [Polyangiaceae bacterium]|nr:CehA/McbA family metallohydrolase [Polyangiaceae bacterium]
MRAHTLGLASSLACSSLACSTPTQTAPPLPARVDLGGATLVVDADDIVLRLGDGPSAHLSIDGARPRPVRVERDVGVTRVVLSAGAPLSLSRAGGAVVASAGGRELTAAMHGALAFAPGSFLGDRRPRDASWALVETGGRVLVVGPSRASIDAGGAVATGPSLSFAWGDPAELGLGITASRCAVFAPPVAGRAALLDDEGRAIGLGLAGDDGALACLSLGAPRRAVALLGGAVVGAPVELSTSPARLPAPRHARLEIVVTDHDTGARLPARVVVRGVDGTPDPTFGSPERATGAGPIFDADDGAVHTALVPGKYKVFATHGVEWSADVVALSVAPAAAARVALALRHVAPTPGWISADLHVHSRGGFDSLVSVEDRVRALVAAGVEFAAATEHNRVGSYASAVMPAASALRWTPAVEVTTVNPLRGHFNVIPWDDPKVPAYQQTSLGRLIDDVRRRAPESVIQVNHPLLDARLGYLLAAHADAATERGRRMIPRGFHSLEVYNGFDLHEVARVDEVRAAYLALVEAGFRIAATGSSDSHSVQYGGAGYPRTYLRADAIDAASVVAAIKGAHTLATSGPLAWLRVGDATFGDAPRREGALLRARVTVAQAPWLALASVELWAGGQKVWERALPRPASPARPDGSLDEARARAVALDEEITVAPPPGARALVLVARGAPSGGEALGIRDFAPMAISSPLWL